MFLARSCRPLKRTPRLEFTAFPALKRWAFFCCPALRDGKHGEAQCFPVRAFVWLYSFHLQALCIRMPLDCHLRIECRFAIIYTPYFH
jgi:hypothetical protein